MKSLSTLILLVSVSVVGCKDPSGDAVPSDAAIVMDDMPPVLDNHAHPEHGPHGGELIELGKEAFHAELVHSDAGIAIFVLDSSATASVAVASEKLTASLKHEGQIKAFDFAASRDSNDSDGMSSRFVCSDPLLDQWLDSGAEGAVVIQIKGKSYTGKLAHDHDDHAGHNH